MDGQVNRQIYRQIWLCGYICYVKIPQTFTVGDFKQMYSIKKNK